jgi:hypothetical protein
MQMSLGEGGELMKLHLSLPQSNHLCSIPGTAFVQQYNAPVATDLT